MGASMSTMSPGQGLNMVNVMNTSGSEFMSPESIVQSSITNNPLVSLARNQSVSQLNSIGQAIQRSLFEIGGNDLDSENSGSAPTPTDEKSKLIEEYGVLALEVQQYTSVAPSIDLGVLNDKIAEMRRKMIKLDERKRVLVSGDSSVFASTVGALNYYLVWILYIFGPIFSSVILLNTLCFNQSSRVTEDADGSAGPFLVYKIFYACLAIVFYPLFLLYGGINPPVFAGFLPFYALNDTGELSWYSYAFGYKKPNPATDNPIVLERGRLLLRFISVVLFLAFMYTFVFFDEISPLSQ